MGEQKVGKVTHYFSRIGVTVMEMTGELKASDRIHIKGATTDFEQTVDSMQVDHKDVDAVSKGDDIGIIVKDTVREQDTTLKIVE